MKIGRILEVLMGGWVPVPRPWAYEKRQDFGGVEIGRGSGRESEEISAVVGSVAELRR